MKVIKIGILPQDKMRDRVLKIARGELKPKASDPKVWFPSMKSLSEVLSDENRALLKAVKTSRPASISELAKITGRKQSNLSRTLKTMSNYGLVELVRENHRVRPVVEAIDFRVELTA